MTTLALVSLAVSVSALVVSALALRRYTEARALAQQALDLARQAQVTPAADGGPRPKPAGTDEPDMQAQADGGPRPKV